MACAATGPLCLKAKVPITQIPKKETQMRTSGSARQRYRWTLTTLSVLTLFALALMGGGSANAASGDRLPTLKHRTSSSQPRPDLSGLRVKAPNAAPIYLIDPEGYRRWIPDPTTYDNLFRDWNGVVVALDVSSVPERPALSRGSVLVRGNGQAPVYLVSNGIKRWITSPAAMDKYYFAWNRIQVLPPVVVDSIPTGGAWS